MELIALEALADNYIWLLHNGSAAIVCDPGKSEPVVQALRQRGLALQSVLITHRHADHCAGLATLMRTCGNAATQVYVPANDPLPPEVLQGIDPAFIQTCHGGETRDVGLGLQARIIDTPGHTAGHIAYFLDQQTGLDAPVLLCGDTLFSAGCGRLFEGTAADMAMSLQRLAALPPNSRVCSGHEYTLSNLRFAHAVEPDNQALQQYTLHCQALRAQQQPTLPSTLAQEKVVNPFLRTTEPPVVAAARRRQADVSDAVAVLAALRAWKNVF